ncbi:MAG: DUF996 domain-containing protein [Candidatus Bathyarchaeia archaeon]
MSLESNKTLGGVGAILIAIGSFVPIIALIGIILVLIAMKGLADHYNERPIFDNALYGFIFGIIGIVAALAIFVMAFVSGAILADPLASIGGLLVALAVAFIFLLLSAIFYRKSFTLISAKSGEKMFDTAGLLLLLGAILTIVLIGFILWFIGWILAAVGFFSIKTPTTQPSPSPPPPPP